MNLEQSLNARSENQCELCRAKTDLSPVAIAPYEADTAEHCALLCRACREQLSAESLDANHWRCLSESMWSPVAAVQVLAWRLLKRLDSDWAHDQLAMLYLEPEVQSWAEAGERHEDDDSEPTLDSNGTRLEAGDTVTLIKDLDVKGAGFTAKRGTAVRGISLTDNPEQIEGRVNGVRIVLLSKYLKKA